MIQFLAKGFKDLAQDGINSKNIDLPQFVNSVKSKYIYNFNEADKPLMKCRNGELDGKRHPETDVIFKTKDIKLIDGTELKGVFPEFDVKFEMKLDSDLYEESDRKQFEEANAKLKEAIENDPKLRKEFTEEQIEQIIDGETPDGYTWHHNEEIGVLQLVDTETHAKTGHTGGKSIWGGGTENR